MDSIIVTGAEGQLGSELCRILGRRAVGWDLPYVDLLAPDKVQKAFEDARPDAVIHAAAYTAVDRAEDEPERCFAVNADATARLVDLCRGRGIPILYVSTDYVFGGGDVRGEPYRETDPVHPQGVYAGSKYQGELAVCRWEKHYIVRTCGLYGKLGTHSPGNFVETMLRLGSQGKKLRIVDDQHCTPSYVPHVARAIVFLLENAPEGTYHVVNGGETTWFGFAQEIFRLAGLEVEIEPITTQEYGAKAPRPAYSVLDTSKYHALPGAPPMPFWREALAEYLDSRR
ncbi:dTDP-4-dehydrorhamnose reductase [Thermostilla marina]